jgi:H+-transporting ATPase
MSTTTTSQPKSPKPMPGPKPDAKDDLKSLPLAEVEKKLGLSPDGLTQVNQREPCGSHSR